MQIAGECLERADRLFSTAWADRRHVHRRADIDCRSVRMNGGHLPSPAGTFRVRHWPVPSCGEFGKEGLGCAVARLMTHHGFSQRRACRLIGFDRSTARDRYRRPDDGERRVRLRALAADRRRFGYRRLGVLLAREGWAVNHKKLYRLYQEDGLTVEGFRRLNIWDNWTFAEKSF